MEGKRLIERLKLTGFLSYGDEGTEIEFEPLNVLIGPNASGKSNLLEAIAILASAPRDLTAPIREGGGVGEWIWKGATATQTAEIDALIHYPGKMSLRYRLTFAQAAQRLEVVDEAIENERPSANESDVYFYYRFLHGHPMINVREFIGEFRLGEFEHPTEIIKELTDRPAKAIASLRRLKRDDLPPDQSVLSQRKDPDVYPEITYVGNQFSSLRLFREWNLGRYTAPRLPQRPDLSGDFLLENDLEHRPEAKRAIRERLQEFYGGVEEITTRVHGGTVQVFIHEKGLNQPVPATRLSDGMLRYLCLLTVLCHPTPPPLVCIEEPELGLHPDVLPAIAELLVEASQRTQLIVTTHSDILVSALSKVPESVIVCERDEKGTKLRRLESAPLKEWLEKYSLGELWLKGEIGGTRW
jgi:predicted ATPase